MQWKPDKAYLVKRAIKISRHCVTAALVAQLDNRSLHPNDPNLDTKHVRMATVDPPSHQPQGRDFDLSNLEAAAVGKDYAVVISKYCRSLYIEYILPSRPPSVGLVQS